MSEQLKEYNSITKTEMQGYMVHVYEWDSPAHPSLPKHAVSVELHDEHDINLSIKTLTDDWKTSLGLMDDRIITGDELFDSKILVFGIGGEDAPRIFDEKVKQMMLEDEHLRMDINPGVVVVRRFGEAEKSEMLQHDIDLALSVAKRVDKEEEGEVRSSDGVEISLLKSKS